VSTSSGVASTSPRYSPKVDNKEVSFGPPKTRKSRALVGFPAFLADVLSAHVANYADPDVARQLVFTSSGGAPLRRGSFRQRVWLPAVKAAGVPERVRFHDLRHACASWLIDAGANPLEVAERLRHTRVTTTLATYGHLFPGTDERLDNLLEAARAHSQERGREPTCRGVVAELPPR
jgi:integrase